MSRVPYQQVATALRAAASALLQGSYSLPHLFHGTEEHFDKFDLAKAGKNDEGFLGRGVYFSTDVTVANSFPVRMEVKVRLQNPYLMELQSLSFQKNLVLREQLGLPASASAQTITTELKRRGHDGVVLDYSPAGYRHKEVVVFDPNDIAIVNVTEPPPDEKDKIIKRRARWAREKAGGW